MSATRALKEAYNLARWLGTFPRKIRNIPLTEGGSVDDNDGVLDKGLGPDDIHDDMCISCELLDIMIMIRHQRVIQKEVS